MNVAVAKTGNGRAVSDLFASAEGRLPGSPAVVAVRREAFETYERLGLPHRRIEEWKYTDLRALVGEVLPLAAAPDTAALKRAADAVKAHAIEGARKLVLVDGVFAADLSDVKALASEVGFKTLRETLEKDAALLMTASTDAVIALNAALATDGVVLSIADGAQLSAPIQIIHIATAASASAFTRSQVAVGNGARATIIESFVAAGAKAYQVSDAVIVTIGDNADVAHIRLMDDAPDAVNITSQFVTVGANTKVNFFNMTSGAAVSRLQGFITLAGEGSDLAINGVNLLQKTEHGDTTLVVDHAVPNCVSREIFRAVIDDRAHSVFQGRIIVRPDAQKTDGKMMTRALLLSDEAEADNKPELEIFADDVSCGHGATAGALDDSLLFYLKARGLPEKQAQALLIQAFVGEAIEQIADDGLREHVIGIAERWLERRS
ncbi:MULTISPECIES: Fe-S cluster assembly protein SufD [Bradyrhizobium]|uniref:Blr4341 protein n=2 Tax=Bradyrhizobium diazoefficiens TaxID=1355477 RepID=Q89M52_BRADU|nr:Fe-S cluster assembly protein SufD [Bradyrhizobium diazoefficiens]MBP1065649.1 Fe-S cluster assembly protein SufD [Bradyrhizobium japonicum]AND89614.1 Fe-S cluster assembly protein SufD [Bradyrhizobium diazoefficiens USDA 110]AWO91266.1 Fe-S cluster assembly protein SufD [Bradyrhizobium diazoefficiens]PDT58625.1 Fe-S cluster assembly protein SufD [Bradyrhizobium diazoefficiens]QBP23103.1 Fe-S cluster assembly protein SufD [Bradyrhizobium diazoefficiens]